MYTSFTNTLRNFQNVLILSFNCQLIHIFLAEKRQHNFQMSLLQYKRVVGKWVPPFVSQTQSRLYQCLFGTALVAQTPQRRFRVEAAGSGLPIETPRDLSILFQNHFVWLGHNGPQIYSESEVPSNFDGPLVVCRVTTFKGKMYRAIKVSQNIANIRIVWNPKKTILAKTTRTNVELINLTANTNIKWFLDLHGAQHSILEWNPQGTIFVYTSHFMLCARDCDGHLLWSAPIRGRATTINQCKWNSSGTLLAVTYDSCKLNIYDADGQCVRKLHRSRLNLNGSVRIAWSSDGSTLACLFDKQCLRLYDMNTIHSCHVYFHDMMFDNCTDFCWMHNSSGIAVACANWLYLTDQKGTRLNRVEFGPLSYISYLSWSSDDSNLMFIMNGIVHIQQVVYSTIISGTGALHCIGSRPILRKPHSDTFTFLDHQRQVVCQDFVFDSVTQKDPRRFKWKLNGRAVRVMCIAWNPMGTQLAVVCVDIQNRVYVCLVH